MCFFTLAQHVVMDFFLKECKSKSYNVKRARARAHTHTHTHTHIYIYIKVKLNKGTNFGDSPHEKKFILTYTNNCC